MKLLILSKSRRGKKSFTLASEDEFGYTIECFDYEGMVIFNNIKNIDWLNEGAHVYLTPNPLPQGRPYFDFTRYDKVNIRKAKVIAQESLVTGRTL